MICICRSNVTLTYRCRDAISSRDGIFHGRERPIVRTRKSTRNNPIPRLSLRLIAFKLQSSRYNFPFGHSEIYHRCRAKRGTRNFSRVGFSIQHLRGRSRSREKDHRRTVFPPLNTGLLTRNPYVGISARELCRA